MKKKKIVFIINNFWIGGVERLLFDLITELCSTHQVELVTVLGSGPLEHEFRNLPVRIYHANPVLVLNNNFFSKLLWLITAPVTTIRLVVFLIKVKPDAVLTSLYHADILGIFSAWLTGIKVRILIQHDTQKLNFFRKYLKLFFTINLTTRVVAVSNTVKEFTTSYWGTSQNKIVTIYNGINIDKFKNAIKPLNEKEVVLGIIGRLEPVKGHMYLLRALKILKDSYQLEPKVIIAGDGSLRKELEEYAKTNLLKRIEFMGSVADASQFLKSIDISIVPSLEEGFGLVVLEGLASGKPIIASDIKVFKELIQSDKNGVLFKVGNAEDLANELKKLIDNPGLVENYIKNINLWMNQVGFKYDMRYVANEYRHIIS